MASRKATLEAALSKLGEEERLQILAVINKDEIVRVRHDLRIMRLKSELEVARRKGVVKSGLAGSRTCARCRSELGRIINRGAFCRWCRHRVCKNCRQYATNDTSSWLCTVCHKQMELTAATGDWMNQFVRRPSKRRDNRIAAVETVKRSLQRSWTFSDASPSPWAALRNSPEMRAYSSMPRHQDCEFIARTAFANRLNLTKTTDNSEPNEPEQTHLDIKTEEKTDESTANENDFTAVEEKASDSDPSCDENMISVPLTDNESSIGSPMVDKRSLSESTSVDQSSIGSPGIEKRFCNDSPVVSSSESPLVEKRTLNDTVIEPLTGTVFRKVTLKKRRVDTRNLPPVSDDASVCSESVSVRAFEEDDRLTNNRASLGTNSPLFRPALHQDTIARSSSDFNDGFLKLKARSDSLASVYSGAGEGRYGSVAVRGEVEFGLQYNYKQGALEIYVKQCRDLAAVDTKRNRSDPYVKVYLLPDKSKSGKRKTRVKKHTLNPVFEETLKFHITLEGLESRTLWLSVWHSDMFGRNDFLGEVTMALENKVFDDPLPKFYTLQERTEPLEELLSSKGELIVGLKFVPPDISTKKGQVKGCLQVLVKEAKNLAAVKSNGTSDPFCKSYLLPDKGRSSKQKTPVLRKCCSPAWHHTFTYPGLTLEELSSRSLELTLWDHDRLASNEFLGGVRLNLGTGKHHGKAVDWMDASGKETTLWQRMLERPNLWVESCLSLRPSLDVRNNS